MATSKRTTAGIGLIAVLAVVVAVTLGAGGAGANSTANYPRSQTLITSGTQWGNIAGTNPYVGNYAAGMVGLVNETLLRYDPLKDKYINWLATSAKFTGAKQYTITVRAGVKWSDGKAFTAKDVAYNLNLMRFSTSTWNNIYLNVQRVIPRGNKVVVNFKETPNYVQWQNAIWNIPMISPAQAAPEIKTAQDLTTYSPKNPVGTGPYQLDPAGWDPTTRVVWVKKAHWWASDLGVSPAPKPKYIIDLVNTSNTNSLSAVLAGVEDLNNNYLPGVQKLVTSGQVKTYYSKAPYMLSANTAWLEPNLTQKPLNDAAFRKALATAINIKQIVNEDYGNLVLPSSPTGLLPMWNKYVSKAAVTKYGFSYSTSKAESMLTAAGYKKDSSGMFLNKDGSKIDLEISVPQGWSDWEAARDMIVSSAGRGDPDHRQGEGLQHLADRPEHGQVRPRGRQQLPAERQPVDVLERHLPPARDHGGHGPDVRELRAVREPDGVEPRPDPGQDPADEHRQDQADQHPAADDPDAGSAADPALVQRDLGSDDAEVLERLAVEHRQPVHPRHVARLSADDGDRRDHPPQVRRRRPVR